MKPKNTGETTAGNQSVAKALRILQVFTQENPYLRLKDISALAGINQATASRLLTTLKVRASLPRRACTTAWAGRCSCAWRAWCCKA